MDPRERELRLRCRDDLRHFATTCLKIRTKSGGLLPFNFNRPQLYLHERLEDQRRRTGMVRSLVLKARQWGCSTYVGARFYHRIIHSFGYRAFILTHEMEATKNLFEMAERYHEHNNPLLKPQTGATNAKELLFDRLDSGYKVGTAGSKEVGRSQTIQMFHGSEVGFWPHAATHVSGVMEAIPNEPGTEAILESTANGVGGLFYGMCMAAQAGEGQYELVFVPWHMHETYALDVPPDWIAPAAWAEYGRMHGLDPRQLYWAYDKNVVAAKACGTSTDEPSWRFKQEYPATVQEAFQAGGADTLIASQHVLRARKQTLPEDPSAPFVVGVDVARGGGDKTRIIDRTGRRIGHRINQRIDTRDLMEVVGHCKRVLDVHGPDAMFVDVTGLGAGVYDRLREQNYAKVHAVNFGAAAEEADKYRNKRSEMWCRVRDQAHDTIGLDLLDDEEVHVHLCAPGYKFDSDSRTLLEPKEKIKERLGISPDIGDAIALTYAETVHKQHAGGNPMARFYGSGGMGESAWQR